MPIFEYVCQECGTRFEKLVLSGRSNKAKCPQCGAEEVEKAISRFSAGTPSASLGSAGAANCSPTGG
ncbi:MAG: zinc ribbon domain-containing protein [Anaerolineae bacterium]|nr:zinc ribbon domain-containing protein [Anaerolineae bacterium]